MPTPSMLHYNKFLSNFGVAAFETAPLYVATKVFPVIHVDKQSDKYRIWDVEDMLRDDYEVLPLNTESAGTDFKWSDDTYYAARRALHIDIDDAERKNMDEDIDLETAAAATLGSKGRLHLERQVFAALFKTSLWSKDMPGVPGSVTPGTNVKQWNDAASTPILDVQAGVDAMLANTGILANTLVVSQPVWRALQNHASILARYSYVTETSSLSTDQVAAVLGIDNLYVVRTNYTSNIEGAAKAQSATLGKVAWLGYIPPVLNQFTPAPAAIFSWDGIAGLPGVTDTVPIQKFRMDEIHSDRIEAIMAFGVKATAPALGYFFPTIVA